VLWQQQQRRSGARSSAARAAAGRLLHALHARQRAERALQARSSVHTAVVRRAARALRTHLYWNTAVPTVSGDEPMSPCRMVAGRWRRGGERAGVGEVEGSCVALLSAHLLCSSSKRAASRTRRETARARGKSLKEHK
jgi:hypothetical protein